MKVYNINNKQYYYVQDLKKTACFTKCRNSNSVFIKRRELEKGIDYDYYKKKQDTYILVDKGVKGTMLMVNTSWVDNYLSSKTIEQDKTFDMEPPIIKLPSDIKLFVDDNGKDHHVEIRGERHYKKCYFLASDVADCFEMPNLENTIMRSSTTYDYGVHYVRFLCKKVNIPLNERIKSRIFLTYVGLLKVIFSSYSKRANSFTDWVCKVVYTAHIGTMDQKMALSSKLMGLTPPDVKKVFDLCGSDISGIYLIRLGQVKDLRKTFSIPETVSNDLIVYKYGRSKNIAVRFWQHVKTYGSLGIEDIELVYYCPIDASLTSEAEADLKKYLIQTNKKFDHPKHSELALMQENDKDTKKMFRQLYIIHISSNIKLIDKLKDANHNIEILQKDKELQNKDLELKDKEIALRDIEIKKLKRAIRKYKRLA